jgi:hypothetical protein
LNVSDLGCSLLRGLKFKTASDCIDGAAESATKQIRQGGVFHGNNNLSASAPDRSKNFDQVQCTVIVDMLDGVIEQKRVPLAPSSR